MVSLYSNNLPKQQQQQQPPTQSSIKQHFNSTSENVEGFFLLCQCTMNTLENGDKKTLTFEHDGEGLKGLKIRISMYKNHTPAAAAAAATSLAPTTNNVCSSFDKYFSSNSEKRGLDDYCRSTDTPFPRINKQSFKLGGNYSSIGMNGKDQPFSASSSASSYNKFGAIGEKNEDVMDSEGETTARSSYYTDGINETPITKKLAADYSDNEPNRTIREDKRFVSPTIYDDTSNWIHNEVDQEACSAFNEVDSGNETRATKFFSKWSAIDP